VALKKIEYMVKGEEFKKRGFFLKNFLLTFWIAVGFAWAKILSPENYSFFICYRIIVYQPEFTHDRY
jgi:hypothetical protein